MWTIKLMLYIHPDLNKYFSADKPLFDQFMALKGEVFRDQKGRLTQRISLGNQTYFIKQYTGVGWKEIIKNLCQLKWPIISAKNEWLAIQACQHIGIPVPTIFAYGIKGWNPASYQSFIIMEALAPTESMEEMTVSWHNESPPSFVLKRNLIKKVADIARSLHTHGMNHRDFYLCHFLMKQPFTIHSPLYLIDLHRAQRRVKTPKRWMIKDLAGLYFSSKDIGLTNKDLYYFMKEYVGLKKNQSLRNVLNTQYDDWQKVKERGEQLYRNHKTK